MSEIYEIIENAIAKGQKALSEYESKKVLKIYGVNTVSEFIVETSEEAKKRASEIGCPVVLKLCAPEITHKSEMDLIEINLKNDTDIEEAFGRLREKQKKVSGDFLLQKMVKGKREYVLGMTRDPSFGPCVMFGMGGIYTEMLKDVAFRVAPLKMRDALEMMDEIYARKTLDAVRGMDAVDREVLGGSLIALGNIALEHDEIMEIDVNPVIISEGKPVAVDALVVLR